MNVHRPWKRDCGHDVLAWLVSGEGDRVGDGRVGRRVQARAQQASAGVGRRG